MQLDAACVLGRFWLRPQQVGASRLDFTILSVSEM